MVVHQAPNTPVPSDDALIDLAVGGNPDSRGALAKRIGKLRWMGQTDEADSLMAQAKTHLGDFGLPPEFDRETD